MSQLLSIPLTIELVTQCWEAAEARVCREVGSKYLEANEETITSYLCGELREEFDDKSKGREFERAFAADLRAGFRFVDLEWVSRGLICRLDHHPKHVEKHTGGDFGFVVARPNVEHIFETRISMHQQGLLVQAKKQSKTGKLGKLTAKQREMLPARLEYTAFLLYMYAARQKELAPFGWISPGGETLATVEADLVKLNGAHPNSIDDYQRILMSAVVSSRDVIEALSKGECGASDQRVIDAVISPKSASSVTIEITWFDGRPPDPPQEHIQQVDSLQQRS